MIFFSTFIPNKYMNSYKFSSLKCISVYVDNSNERTDVHSFSNNGKHQ